MKNAFIFCIFGIVLFGACSAQGQNVQNPNAQSQNIEQSIIGSWIDHRANTWVFNNDRNGIRRISNVELTFRFLVAGEKVATYFSEQSFGYTTYHPAFYIFDIMLSSDGGTLIMEDGNDRFWLTKQ